MIYSAFLHSHTEKAFLKTDQGTLVKALEKHAGRQNVSPLGI